MAPTLAVQNGTATINIGQPVTYHFDFGPGHAVSAKPAATSAPAVPVAPAAPPQPIAAPTQSADPNAARPLIPPRTPDLAPTGPTRSGLAPETTGSAPAATPRLSEPGTLQGVFILSQDYLVLSLNPVGNGALGASPGTLSGSPTGNVASPGAPGTAAIPTGPQPAPNAAGGGVRQDAFVLILRRGPVTRPRRRGDDSVRDASQKRSERFCEASRTAQFCASA